MQHIGSRITFLVVAFGLWMNTSATPITLPGSSMMEPAQVHVRVLNSSPMQASVTCVYTYTQLAPNVDRFVIPVPNGATGVVAWIEGQRMQHSVSDIVYPTTIPEAPVLQMVEIWGGWSTAGVVLTVSYRMPLIMRGDDGYYYYPAGYAKLAEADPAGVPTVVFFDETPWVLDIAEMWLEGQPHPFELYSNFATTVISADDESASLDLMAKVTKKDPLSLSVSPFGTIYRSQAFDVVVAGRDLADVSGWKFTLGDVDVTADLANKMVPGLSLSACQSTYRVRRVTGRMIIEKVGEGVQRFRVEATMPDGSVRSGTAWWTVVDNEEEPGGNGCCPPNKGRLIRAIQKHGPR